MQTHKALRDEVHYLLNEYQTHVKQWVLSLQKVSPTSGDNDLLLEKILKIDQQLQCAVKKCNFNLLIRMCSGGASKVATANS
jgi:hypothetical protein